MPGIRICVWICVTYIESTGRRGGDACLYQVGGRWSLAGRGAGVRCIRDKERAVRARFPVHVLPPSLSFSPSLSLSRERERERERGTRDQDPPVPFWPRPQTKTEKRGETTKYPLNSFHGAEIRIDERASDPVPASSLEIGITRWQRHAGARFQRASLLAWG